MTSFVSNCHCFLYNFTFVNNFWIPRLGIPHVVIPRVGIHAKAIPRAEMHVSVSVKCLFIVFDQNWNVSINFIQTYKYQIS